MMCLSKKGEEEISESRKRKICGRKYKARLFIEPGIDDLV